MAGPDDVGDGPPGVGQIDTKLEAIGRLAAGIAHEINTPTQYISDNTTFLQEAFGHLVKALEACRGVVEAAASGGAVPPATIEEAQRVLQRARIDYLVAQVSPAIEQSLEGLSMVMRIVRAMKDFSHPGSDEREITDLHQLIETTVTVTRNEWKYKAKLDKRLDEMLPLVPCFRGELGQALLNLIVNAAQAMGSELGQIIISTSHDADYAEICVEDTGSGIPPELCAKVFDPFFTTKERGKGTGQGLALVKSVAEMHGGSITVDSELGRGTTMRLRLPLEAPRSEDT